MAAPDWFGVVRTEYLEDFVRAGGAAVKFAVSPAADGRRALRDHLQTAAEENGFQFAFVDAITTRLHLIDRLFHEVARQIDWDALAYSYLSRFLTQERLKLPDGHDGLTLGSVAAVNGRDEKDLRNVVSGWLWKELFHDYEMSQEFRLAMIRLCQAQLDPETDPALKEAVEQWLRGELHLISAVKRALIFQKIARHNARHMLFSLSHWLKVAGKSGLVLAVDIARYAENVPRAAREEGIYYSNSAATDLYEVLREFVDATDELEFCFVAVIAGPEFLNDDRRGVKNYQALQMRIWDEVRDRNLPNPLSSLVRLDASGLAFAGRGEE
jgi:hypothetical protein